MVNLSSSGTNTPTDLELQLRGYGVTTAEILYRLPDHQLLMNTFTWQFLDVAPKYPRLERFLDFWSIKLPMAPIVEVKIAQRLLLSNGEMRILTGVRSFN